MGVGPRPDRLDVAGHLLEPMGLSRQGVADEHHPAPCVSELAAPERLGEPMVDIG
ncbi:hypothetical protein [Sorangium sp. So ce426]|uniref:hypothetical protein n=1 Tax=unclassified Sorangium TaxID=2621164 RepID=UPI003F5AE0D3